MARKIVCTLVSVYVSCTASPKHFLQYKINMCSLNPPYFFKCCTKSDCFYFDTTHSFLIKQHVKMLTLKDLKYLRSYHALHKFASVHINLLWEGRKSNRGYIYFLKSQKQHYRYYKISLCFIVKYFCFKALFVQFNYIMVKYKLLYFKDKETAFKT